MTLHILVLRTAAVISMGLASVPAPHPDDSAPAVAVASRTVVPPAPWVADDPADSLYRAGRQAMIDSKFDQAARLFGELVSKHPQSAYVGDALYYRGYALYRIGGEGNLREALRALETEIQRFPKAATIGDANELAVRIRGALAQRGDARAAEQVASAASVRCTRDRQADDMRAEAMNALMHMDAASAVPILRQVLERRDACNAALRKKAVFLLSQKQTPETVRLLIDATRNDPSADVRADAVFWLGQVRSSAAAEALEEIALRSPEPALRDKAIFALGQQNTERSAVLLRRIAEDGTTSRHARKQAIWALGQQSSRANADFLRALFPRLDSAGDDIQKHLLFSLAQMRGHGNEAWLLGVAGDQRYSLEVRKHAVFSAGQALVAGKELVALYDRVSERAMKEELIRAMADSRDPAASDRVVAIAKGDRDPALRKSAIFWLGQKNDPRIRQLLLDIINNG